MRRVKRYWAMAAVAILVVTVATLFVVKPVWLDQRVKLLVFKVKDRLTPHLSVSEVSDRLFAVQSGTLLVGGGKPELVEFLDYNCGGCKRQAQVLDALRNEGLQYRLIVRHNPLKGNSSEQAALAVIAAGQQGKAEQLHNAFLRREGRLDENSILSIATDLGIDTTRLAAGMKAAEVVARLDADRDLAWQLRILGAPIFVAGNEIHKGVLSRALLLDLLDPDGELTLHLR